MEYVSQLTIGEDGGGENLYRLLGVAVGFAAAFGCRELIEGLEGLCDFSDAAYEQDWFLISKCILGVCFGSQVRDLLPGKTIQMKFMKK